MMTIISTVCAQHLFPNPRVHKSRYICFGDATPFASKQPILPRFSPASFSTFFLLPFSAPSFFPLCLFWTRFICRGVFVICTLKLKKNVAEQENSAPNDTWRLSLYGSNCIIHLLKTPRVEDAENLHNPSHFRFHTQNSLAEAKTNSARFHFAIETWIGKTNHGTWLYETASVSRVPSTAGQRRPPRKRFLKDAAIQRQPLASIWGRPYSVIYRMWPDFPKSLLPRTAYYGLNQSQ